MFYIISSHMNAFYYSHIGKPKLRLPVGDIFKKIKPGVERCSYISITLFLNQFIVNI